MTTWKVVSSSISQDGQELAVTVVMGSFRLTWFFNLWTGERYAIHTE